MGTFLTQLGDSPDADKQADIITWLLRLMPSNPTITGEIGEASHSSNTTSLAYLMRDYGYALAGSRLYGHGSMVINTIRMGAKPKRNERGFDLEKRGLVQAKLEFDSGSTNHYHNQRVSLLPPTLCLPKAAGFRK